jgi:hypothetical protein
MNNKIVTYDRKGFIINGKREFLIGGEFHYFRVPSQQWEDRLKKMKSTGANLISVYIAWNMHEPIEGQERWTGDYDLERFLSLCEKYGFYVLIKPGPYICAELDFGGHPDWLIQKIARKEIKLRMLDEGYLKLCKKWYTTVSEKISKHLITNGGSIIAAQVENEYDHLIEYGEKTITEQDAIDYLMKLKSIMEECGIDVPKFANEAAFLRGKGVIDTRTYYPNIPGLWMWEFGIFEDKIIQAKKTQSDSPVMILELQAGWFSQIGTPTYEPDLNVVSGVSKSVLIQGASIINYYMMVGGTTFPFMGARGDIFFQGGLGNITSYDFGGSPVRESGELHEEKYYWVKGFIRFAKEFSNLILESDGKSYVSIVSGGENIALLGSEGFTLDYSLDKTRENFNVYEEGNKYGRFFFIRNLEKEDKQLSLRVSEEFAGRELMFKTKIHGRETRMLPVTFSIPDTGIIINYATSEVLLSKKYKEGTAFIIYGKKGTDGEMCLNTEVSKIQVIKGDIKAEQSEIGSILTYKHNGINIVQVEDVTLFIIEEGMIGGVEELSSGILFNNLYYIESIQENTTNIELAVQLKENSKYEIFYFSFSDETSYSEIAINGKRYPLVRGANSNGYSVSLDSGNFENPFEFKWTSEWKYSGDTLEINSNHNTDDWVVLDKPISLEEAGFFEHGYYWYKGQFYLENEPEIIFMDYIHNDTDRMFIYINGSIVYKSYNKPIKMKDINSYLKIGRNDITILYANEFHNKSHPHEGEIVKYSGIMQKFVLHGLYKDGRPINISIERFFVKKGLRGINEGFHTPEYNDDKWLTAPDAEKLVTSPELGHIVWFRRKFTYKTIEGVSAPIVFKTKEADQRLTVYVNGRATARYDILGPQQEFYIPEAFLNPARENILAIVLECPAFYDELQSGYRRGYMYNPEIAPKFVTKKESIKIE